MSASREDNASSDAQLSSHFVGDLLDSIIVDIASECHRIAKLGLDRNLVDYVLVLNSTETNFLARLLILIAFFCSFLFAVTIFQLSSHFFGDLLDSIIVDIASECHRIAKLGLDRNLEDEEEELRLSTQARVRAADPSNTGETNSKYVVDIFGQTHPAIATEVFECMNCGRQIMAGRFAPHLEKCMGKGRKARLKTARSSTAAQNRYSRGSPASTYSPYSNSTSTNQLSNGSTGVAGEELSNGTSEEP